MVKLYIDGFDNQTFTCSDHSGGVASVQKLGNQDVLDFNFYAHAHPGFWMTKDQLASGKPITVDAIQERQKFAVQKD